MSRSILVVTLALVASPAFADDRHTPPWASCPDEKAKLDDKVQWVKKLGCDWSGMAASTCSEGASTAIALTNAGIEVCRTHFEKTADALKEYDALGKRCETKFANRTKKKLDNELDVATCRLQAAQLLATLHR